MKSFQELVFPALSQFFAAREPVPPWSLSYWTSDTGMTVVSTLVGAVVGALIAGVIQWRVSKTEFLRNREQARIDRIDAQRAVALRITSKMFTMTNQLYSIMSTMLSSLERAKQAGNESLALWQRFQPISGIPTDPSRIDDDEIALMFALGKGDIAMNLHMHGDRWGQNVQLSPATTDRPDASPNVRSCRYDGFDRRGTQKARAQDVRVGGHCTAPP
ncbi:hypothetical protein [Rhizobium sp. RAF56]|uniref:hypothetical protein n=1 Tax=Rhizobium sp. RAF56 TaxID=3233062 RepID=UPI003F97D090